MDEYLDQICDLKDNSSVYQIGRGAETSLTKSKKLDKSITSRGKSQSFKLPGSKVRERPSIKSGSSNSGLVTDYIESGSIFDLNR